MSHTDLNSLENLVDELLKTCSSFNEENRNLKSRLNTLEQDHAALKRKQEDVRGRVETMITRLKLLEQGKS